MSVFDSIKSVLSGDASPTELMDDVRSLVGDVDLGRLQERFEAAGLGDKVQSWIGTGENAPLSADEVKRALDPEQLQALADEAGVAVDEAAAHVAEDLPQLVDRLTPDGTLAHG